MAPLPVALTWPEGNRLAPIETIASGPLEAYKASRSVATMAPARSPACALSRSLFWLCYATADHVQGATNFALVAGSATGCTLVLFTEADLHAGHSTHEIPLHQGANRTGATWHVALPALDSSLLYGEAICTICSGNIRTSGGPLNGESRLCRFVSFNIHI